MFKQHFNVVLEQFLSYLICVAQGRKVKQPHLEPEMEQKWRQKIIAQHIHNKLDAKKELQMQINTRPEIGHAS